MQIWAIKHSVLAVVVNAGKSLPTQEFLSLSPFSPASGYHTTCYPVPGEQISYRSCVPSKETFLARTGGNSFHVSLYWESQPQCKRGISTPISNKCGVAGWTQLGQMLPTVAQSSRQDARWSPCSRKESSSQGAGKCITEEHQPIHSWWDQHTGTKATLHIGAAALQMQANPSSMHAPHFGSLFLHGSNLKNNLSNFLRLEL